MPDRGLVVIGCQGNFVTLKTGFFLFKHSCGGTLAVGVDGFLVLSAGPLCQERATGTDQCPGHCLHRDNLRPCPARCECAFVREILTTVNQGSSGGSENRAVHALPAGRSARSEPAPTGVRSAARTKAPGRPPEVEHCRAARSLCRAGRDSARGA